MATKVRAIPAGYHTLTPSLVVGDARKAVEFYKKAFGAQQLMIMPGSDGKIMHAEIKIGDSRLMLCSECTERRNLAPATLNGNTGALYLYVKNVDSAFDQAVKAGGKSIQGVSDMFWGDRVGELVDPSGHRWMLATHTKDLTSEQIRLGAEAFFASMAKK